MNLEVKNLSISYGDKIIFRNISFILGEKEILGICGKNGSGKTTLCNAIAKIAGDDCDIEGEITLDNENIKTLSIAEKCKSVGIIFQDPDNQIFAPYVEDELAFAVENLLIPREEIEKRIKEVLFACGISHLRYRNTTTLSGGEKQLIAIASVLIMRPKILIADEINSNIDKEKKEIINKIIIEYAQNYGSIIYVTHDENDKKICNRIIDLSEGEL
jgi:energy-coupling factor transporter ATP-binding protein EcfA2